MGNENALIESFKAAGIEPTKKNKPVVSNELIEKLQAAGIQPTIGKSNLGSLEEGYETQSVADNSIRIANSKINNLEDANDDEKVYLKNFHKDVGKKFEDGKEITNEDFEEAIKVLNGTHADYGTTGDKAADIAKGVFAGMGSGALVGSALPGAGTAIGTVVGGIGGGALMALSKPYYWDKYGMPKVLKAGEKPPTDATTVSAWGGKESAEDDGVVAKSAKAFYNVALDGLKIVPNLAKIGYGIVTGEEAKWTNDVNAAVDNIKFQESSSAKSVIDTSKVNSFGDLLNSDIYDFNPQTLAYTLTSVLGFAAQFALGGRMAGVAKAGVNAERVALAAGKTTEQVASAVKIAQYQKQLIASSAISTNQGLEAVEAAGLEGREKYVVAGIIAGTIGALEVGFAGVEMRLMGGVAKKQMSKVVSESVVKEFVASGAKLNSKTLEAIYKSALKKSAIAIPQFLKNVAKEGNKEGFEEITQQYAQEAIEQIYDKTVQDKFHADVESPKVFAESLAGYISGAMMGGFGAVQNPDKQQKQSESIYQAVKQGREKQLLDQFHNMVLSGDMTPKDEKSAIRKVEEFKGYFERTKDVPGGFENKAKAAQIIYSTDNIDAHIEKLKKENEETKKVEVEAKIKALTKKKNELVNKLTDLYAGGAKPAEGKEPKSKTEAAEEDIQQPASQVESEDLKETTAVTDDAKRITKFAAKLAKGETPELPEQIEFYEKHKEEIVRQATHIAKSSALQEVLDSQKASGLQEEGKTEPAVTGEKVDSSVAGPETINPVDKVYEEGFKKLGIETKEQKIEFFQNANKDTQAEIIKLEKQLERDKDEIHWEAKGVIKKKIESLKNSIKSSEKRILDLSKEEEKSVVEETVPVKEESVVPIKKYSDKEFKTLPISKQHEALSEHLKNTKSKQTSGEIVPTGKSTIGIQVGNKVLQVAASTNAKISKISRANAGEKVTLKYVSKEEWNPEGKVISKLTDKPYGDKIEIYHKNTLVGHVQVDNYTKEEKAAQAKKELPKTPEAKLVEKTFSEKYATLQAKLREAKVTDKDAVSSIQEQIRELQQKEGQAEPAKETKLEQTTKKLTSQQIRDLVSHLKIAVKKLDEPGNITMVIIPFQKQIVKGALKVFIKTIETTADIVQSVEEMMAWIKKYHRADWNKLTEAEQEKAKQDVINHMQSNVTETTQEQDHEKRLTNLSDLQNITGQEQNDPVKASQAINGEEGNRANVDKAKIKQYYEQIMDSKKFDKLEDIETQLRKVFHPDKRFTQKGKLKENIKALVDSTNPQFKAIGQHLEKLSLGKIVSLGNFFRSQVGMPNFYLNVKHDKDTKRSDWSIDDSNIFFEEQYTAIAKQKLEALGQQGYASEKEKLSAAKKKVKGQKAHTELDIKFLSDITGIPIKLWSKYQSAPSFRVTYESRKRSNNPEISKWTIGKTFEEWGLTLPFQNLVSKEYQEIKKIILESPYKEGSAINTISLATPIEEKMNMLTSKFKNQVYDQKSSFEQISHFTWILQHIGDKEYQDSDFFKDNKIVQWTKGKPLAYYAISGARAGKKGVNNSNMNDNDVRKTIIEAWKKGKNEDSYFQAAGQFADKDKFQFVRVPKHTNITQLKKDYRTRLENQEKNKKYINDQIKIIEASIEFYKDLKVEDAEALVWNYAYNFNELNDILNGDISQYGDDARNPTSIIKDLFKRNGTMGSPGMPIDTEVEGGIGKTHGMIVISLPSAKYMHPTEGEKEFEKQGDGSSWQPRYMSDAIKVSSGEAYDFNSIIKAATSLTNPNGNRLLDKSSTDTVDELAQQYPDSFYAELDQFFKDHPEVNKITTNHSAKKHKGTEVLEWSKRDQFDSKKHLITVNNEHLRFQQDYVNDGKLKKGFIPIQKYKNELPADEAFDIVNIRNVQLTRQLQDYIDGVIMLDDTKLRELVLKALDYQAILEQEEKDQKEPNENDQPVNQDDYISQDRKDITELVNYMGPDGERVAFESQFLRNWITKFLTNQVTKEALGRLSNNCRYKDSEYIESKDFKLEDAVIIKEGKHTGKVRLPDIAISELSGARGPSEAFSSLEKALNHITANQDEFSDMYDLQGNILEHEIDKTDAGYVIRGEVLQTTRIPADNWHSHPACRVKYLLPAAAKNIIMFPKGLQKGAGFDMDGDNHTVEGIFKRKGKVVKDGTRGMANESFKLATQWYYKSKNQAELYAAIETKKGFTKILDKLQNKQVLYKDSIEGFVQMRKMYQVGMKVVGIAANIQATMDYIRKHDVKLLQNLSFPKTKLDENGDTVFSGNNSGNSFTSKDNTKEFWSNLLNLAVDNGNELAIELLGFNEITANWYGLLVGRGYNIENLASFFNHPFVKHVIAVMRSTQSVQSTEEKKDMLRNMAKIAFGQATEKEFKSSWNNPASIELTAEDFNDTEKGNYNILKKLKEFENINFDLRHIQTVIKGQDKAPGSFAAWYSQSDSIEKVSKKITGNELKKVDTTNLRNSPYLQGTETQKAATESIWRKYSPMMSKVGQEIIKAFEKQNTDPYKIRNNKGVFSRLKKADMLALDKAIDIITSIESRHMEKSFTQLEKDLFKRVSNKANDKYKPIFDMLELRDEDGERRMVLQFGLQRKEINKDDLKKVQDLIDELYFNEDKILKQLGKDLVDYLAYQYNFSASTLSGAYTNLLSLKLKSAIGTELYNTIVAWQDGNPEFTIEQYIAEIKRLNPTLNFGVETPALKDEEKSKTKIYKFEKKAQQQKSSKSAIDTEKEREAKIAKLKKALPGIEVKMDSTIQGAGELSADGKVIKLNPNYNYSDTSIHEFGHALIDILGGTNNAFIRKGIEQLRGTKLWSDVEGEYPELDQDMLAKEVLATAIGQEGAQAWNDQKKKSAFKNWLDVMFMKLKRLLGIEKNVAKNLASQLLAGSVITTETIATGKIQKQSISPKDVIASIKKASKQIEFNKKEHTYKIGEIEPLAVTKAIDYHDEYRYDGPKKKEFEDTSDIGTSLHAILEDTINGDEIRNAEQYFGDTIVDGEAITAKQLYDDFVDQIEDLVERLSINGAQLASEVKIANIDANRAGSIDLIRVRRDNAIDIFDLKTSIRSIYDSAYSTSFKDKKTKEEHQGLQLASYGRMLELGDKTTGLEKHKINTLNIIPLKYTLKEGKIVAFEFEGTHSLGYNLYKPETDSKILHNPDGDFKAQLDSSISDWKTYAQRTGYSVQDHIYAKDKVEEILLKTDKKDKANQTAQKEFIELNKIEKNFEAQYKLWQQDKERIQDLKETNGDVSKMSEEELMDAYYTLKKYNDVAQEGYMKDIMYHITLRLRANQNTFLKDKVPDFDPENASKEDMTKMDEFFMALSDVSEAHPDLQWMNKRFKQEVRNANEEYQALVIKGNRLAKAVVESKQSFWSKIKRWFNPFSDNSEYFSNLSEGDKFKAINDKSLSKEEIELIKFITKFKSEFQITHEEAGGIFNPQMVVKIDPTAKELVSTHGLFRAYIHSLGSSYALRHVQIYFDNPSTGKKEYKYYDEIRNDLISYSENGIINKIKAAYYITKYSIQAKKQLRTGFQGDGKTPIKNREQSEYTLTEGGKLTSKFGHQRALDRPFSKDNYAAFMNYAKDMIFIKHMNKMIPLVESIEHFQREIGGGDRVTADKNTRQHTLAFLSNWKRGMLLQETITSGDARIDATLKFLRHWTTMRVMMFNFKLGFFNLLVGKYNQFRKQNAETIFKGEALLLKDYAKHGFDSEESKIFNFVRRWQFSSFEPDTNVVSNISTFFKDLSGASMKVSENWTRASSGLSAIPDKVLEDWIAKDGSLILEGLSEKEANERQKEFELIIEKALKAISDVQGKYSKDEWRGFQHFEIGKAAGQFKVWMPDMILSRFGKKHLTSFAEQAGGSVRVNWNMGVRGILAEIQKPGFFSSQTIEAVSIRQNFKELMGIASTYLLLLAASDDDDDKTAANTLARLLNEMGGIYSTNLARGVITTPVPFTSTLLQILDALDSRHKRYETNTKWHNKGDLKIIDEVGGLFPYQQFPKQISQAAKLMME